MAKLKIRNFGPITTGFNENDGWIEISPVTIFIGNQATGKSTIAKLYATFTWLEKALVRKDFLPGDLTIDAFKDNYLAYHSIKSYWHENSEIEYIGTAFKFTIANNKFVTDKISDTYVKPKIGYAPAERNLLSTIPNPDRVPGLLRSLFTYLADYDEARRFFSGKEIPIIDNYSYLYDSSTEKTYIISKDKGKKRVELNEASSGIQSLVPISIVSQYYSKHQVERYSSNKQMLTLHEQKIAEKDYSDLISILGVAGAAELIAALTSEKNNGRHAFFGIFSLLGALGLGMSSNSEPKKQLSPIQSKKLEGEVKEKEKEVQKIIESRFINIVEEPEQNLFPTSQNKILYDLLECNNMSADNQLIITTHSPYIIAYLILSAKVKNMLERGVDAEKTNHIVPKAAATEGDTITIYETSEVGTITRVKPYKYLPSDDNCLNNAMIKSDEDFSKLLDIEGD